MKLTPNRFSMIVEDLTTKTGFSSYLFRTNEFEEFKQFLEAEGHNEFLDLMQTEEVDGMELLQTTEVDAVMIRVSL